MGGVDVHFRLGRLVEGEWHPASGSPSEIQELRQGGIHNDETGMLSFFFSVAAEMAMVGD